MTDSPSSNSPTEPRRTAAISSGKYSSGSVFRLVREIRGSAYSVGDEFILSEEQDCFNPSILRLGGVGENYFADPSGRPLKIEAGDKQIDSIFQLVEPTAVPLLEEIKVVSPPVRNVSETEFSAFRSGLADLLTEISAVTPTQGERGERGTRGYTGVQGAKGDKGDKGDQGEQGQAGITGERGQQGEQGVAGVQGDKGDKGDTGSSGADGVQGVQGNKGDKGDRGDQGLQGVQGKKGDTGVAGKKGDKGDKGDRGEQGLRGVSGARGEAGVAGVAGKRGADGADGKAGVKGVRGAKGDKGSTGDSGIVSAKFPLVYDAAEKTISIDEARLDKILKKILGGGKVSPQDMGWLASTGGGGKVAVHINGSKITPDVRTLDFTGAGVTASKVGGKVTINFTGTGGGTAAAGTNFYYRENPPVAIDGVTIGSRWMDSDNGQEYIYINDGNTQQWVQPAIPNVISSVVHTVVTISAATYEASNLDYYIGVSSGVPSTITLPEGPAYGREVIIKDESGQSNTYPITVVGADSALIDNQAGVTIDTNNRAIHFIYNSGWRII